MEGNAYLATKWADARTNSHDEGNAMLSLFTNLEVSVREFASKAARREEGAGIVEYLLLVVFIALALIVALAFFTGRLGSAFSKAGTTLG